LKQSSSVQHTQNQEQHNSNIIIKTITADEQYIRAWRKQKPLILDGRFAYGWAKIDEHRIIIVGGMDADCNALSSGYIYDVRTQQSTPLLNDMPDALSDCCVVANREYLYVIGGRDANDEIMNTVYRLCLKTFQWSTMAPMGTDRVYCAAALKENYIYVFGGDNHDYGLLPSVERYSIDNNSWEDLQDRPKGTSVGHCAISTTGSEIYIVDDDTCSVDVFDTGPSLSWKSPTYLRDMPEVRRFAAAVVVKKKYLVVIGGINEDGAVTASSLIYDIWCNRWSLTPASMDMIEARYDHTAALLDRKIVVTGGRGRYRNTLTSVECIDADALLEYAPLHYPLPTLLFNRILEIGKFEMDHVD